MENLPFGLLLMVAGMVTVFAILLIVIYGSRLLIAIVNKIVPPEETAAKADKPGSVSSEAKAVLEAAVKEITGGKGHIVKITRL